MGLRHRMLKLPLMLVLLVVGQNHANLSKINKEKLAKYRQMLEKAELAAAGNDTDATVTDGTPKNRECEPPECLVEPPPDKVDHPDPGGNKNRKCDDVADCADSARADLDNTAGDSTKTDQKQLGQLIKGILGQLSSGNSVKMVVDIKNPEVMIGKNEGNTGKTTDAEKMAKAFRQASGCVGPHCNEITRKT